MMQHTFFGFGNCIELLQALCFEQRIGIAWWYLQYWLVSNAVELVQWPPELPHTERVASRKNVPPLDFCLSLRSFCDGNDRIVFYHIHAQSYQLSYKRSQHRHSQTNQSVTSDE
jgi:hypothetical protein